MALGMVAMIVNPPKPMPEQQNQEAKPVDDGKSDKSMAYVQAENFVRERLKNPAGASFPWSGDVEALGNNRYQVESYVDATNGFGATIRTHYTCVVRKSGDTWSLEDLDF
jgi:hypothetical protein